MTRKYGYGQWTAESGLRQRLTDAIREAKTTSCYCHHLIFPGTICPNCNEVAGSAAMTDKPDWVLEEERQEAEDAYLDHIREDQ